MSYTNDDNVFDDLMIYNVFLNKQTAAEYFRLPPSSVRQARNPDAVRASNQVSLKRRF